MTTLVLQPSHTISHYRGIWINVLVMHRKVHGQSQTLVLKAVFQSTSIIRFGSFFSSCPTSFTFIALQVLSWNFLPLKLNFEALDYIVTLCLSTRRYWNWFLYYRIAPPEALTDHLSVDFWSSWYRMSWRFPFSFAIGQEASLATVSQDYCLIQRAQYRYFWAFQTVRLFSEYHSS